MIGIGLLLLNQAMAQAPLNLVIFDYAPYNYEEAGDAEGFATDIVRETFCGWKSLSPLHPSLGRAVLLK